MKKRREKHSREKVAYSCSKGLKKEGKGHLPGMLEAAWSRGGRLRDEARYSDQTREHPRHVRKSILCSKSDKKHRVVSRKISHSCLFPTDRAEEAGVVWEN